MKNKWKKAIEGVIKANSVWFGVCQGRYCGECVFNLSPGYCFDVEECYEPRRDVFSQREIALSNPQLKVKKSLIFEKGE